MLKSHGLVGRCEFAPASTILDARQGFVVDDTVTVVAEVSVLAESVTFVRDSELPPSGVLTPGSTEVLGGKFTWKARLFAALGPGSLWHCCDVLWATGAVQEPARLWSCLRVVLCGKAPHCHPCMVTTRSRCHGSLAVPFTAPLTQPVT